MLILRLEPAQNAKKPKKEQVVEQEPDIQNEVAP